MTAEVHKSVEVPIPPEEAFRIFTQEFDAWWVRSPTTFFDGARAREMRIEAGVGGRVLEVYGDDDALERGRITAWEPPSRLVVDMWDGSEATFTFDAEANGTRVAVTHSPPAGVEPDSSVAGTLDAMVSFFADRARDPGARPWNERDLPRLSPLLHYRDPIAAAHWLVTGFGLEGRPPERGQLPRDFPIPLRLGIAAVIIVGSDEVRSHDHGVYAYVDDLDAHFARARGAGATIVRDITTHGDRSYVAEDLEGHHWTFAQARPTQRT
jgi:uncharacterized glyoxalase superfamily protein PhnB